MVSIIIPHFNRSQLIKATLDSVKIQTFADWEIIIIDDGSDEEEWEMLKAYEEAKIKIFKRTNGEKGPSRCRNIGVTKSVGEYLLFLDSDDLLADFCLEQRVRAMETFSDVKMGVFLMEEFTLIPGDMKRNFNSSVPFSQLIAEFIQGKNPWNLTCPIWKRDFFTAIAGFDEKFVVMEDPDLQLRALTVAGEQIKIFYDKPADCYYRINHIDKTKLNFWYHSIFFRLQFYKKITGGIFGEEFILVHSNDIRIGIYNLIKTFLYARKNMFPELYLELLEWMKESKLFSTFTIAKIRFLVDTGNSASSFLQKIRAKGICYKLLPSR